MSTIQCNIVSPEGELFSGPVELLSAEGGAGEIAITPRHAPLLTNLKPGPVKLCLLYTSPSPRDKRQSRMPSSA